MCGRYSAELKEANLEKNFGALKSKVSLSPRYNIAPSQDAPVIIEDKGRRLELFRWGLIPSWAKDPAIGCKMINARCESLVEKPSFKRPLRKSRCLVVADGFYEWRERPGAKKTPYRVALESREPFAMAGLWDVWKKPDGTTLRSFTIVTTEANEALREIHDRMPVILPRDAQDVWLDPASGLQRLLPLLKPFADATIEFYEVSALVNKPENEGPMLIEPAPVMAEQQELF